MPVVKQVNFKDDSVGEFVLADAVFGAVVHVPAMHQVVTAQLANLRQGTHSAKSRGEVRGGGRKPWRQKHTGRARQGSIRSPIWAGGGVAHGPKPRSYRQKVNKKVRSLAMRSALTVKAQEGHLLVVTNLELERPMTKVMLAFLQKVDAAEKPLIVVHQSMPAVNKSVSNLSGAKVLHVDSINVYDILDHSNLLLTPEAARRIEGVYGN